MPPKDKDEEEKIEDQESGEEEDLDQEEETSDDNEETEEEEDLSPEELRARLQKAQARLHKVNEEAKSRRLELERLRKEKQEKEEAELSEAQKAEKRAEKAEADLEELRKKNYSLQLSRELDSVVRELKLEFITDQAREDALLFLDKEKIGEDFAGLEDEVKALHKKRSHLFGKPDPDRFIQDGRRRSHGNGRVPMREKIETKKRRIPPL